MQIPALLMSPLRRAMTMSLTGRPEGEFRSAQHEGSPGTLTGRPEGEFRSAQHEGVAVSAVDIPQPPPDIVPMPPTPHPRPSPDTPPEVTPGSPPEILPPPAPPSGPDLPAPWVK